MTVPEGRQVENGRYAIAPGKAQDVQVNVPTRYIRSREPYEKNDILIETNDPDTPLVRLVMRLQVVDVLVVSPTTINFGAVKPRSINTRQVTVTNKSESVVTLTKISAFPETVLTASHAGNIRIEPGKSVDLTVTYKPSVPDNRFLGLLQVETSLEELAVKTIQVRASVEGK